MSVDNALDYVASTLEFTPHSVLQGIMDTAPLMHDSRTGKLDAILDPNAIIMDKDEARIAMDFLQDFQMGYASDGKGNSVPVPMTVYEDKVPFKRRHPYLYKALCIGGLILTMGLTVAISGCTTDESHSGNNEIRSVSYTNGNDGIYNTSDDGILVKLVGWNSQIKIGRDIGENLTYLSEKLRPGGAVSLTYKQGAEGYVAVTVGDIKEPWEVAAIKEANARVEQERQQKAMNDMGGICLGTGIFVGMSILAYVLADKLKEWIEERAEIKKLEYPSPEHPKRTEWRNKFKNR